MKGDEEDRNDHFVMEVETDDEDNEGLCLHPDHHYSHDSDLTARNSSTALDSPTAIWPQSYRKSIDIYTSVTPSSMGFLRSPFLNSPKGGGSEASLTRRLISTSSLGKEEKSGWIVEEERQLPSALQSRSSSIELPPPQQCSYSQTMLNALNALCGIGILSTPYALREGGWLSLLLLPIFGIITCYTGILLKRCLESSPGLETYPDIGQAAFGTFGRFFIAVVLYLELYSSCVEYLIMMSDNMASQFPNAQLDVFGIHLSSYQLCAIISTLVIMPTVWLRNLRSLSYISVGGVIFLVMVVICLLWVGVIDGVGFHPAGTALNLAKIPVTIGLYSFCYGSHSVFPNIYSSMSEPSRFPSVLIISFATVFVLYMGVAVSGFLMFGEATKSQFTLNMPSKFAASKLAGWVMVLTPVTKYALTLLPIAFGLEDLMPDRHLRSYGVSILIRTLLVISTLIIALAVPYFASLTALIGSLLVMLVSLVFPCACYMKLGRLKIYQVAVCSVIIVVGIVCSIFGTISAIQSMADEKS